MQIRLYNYIKKHNSSARPPSDGGTLVDIVLKKQTSFNAPVFILKLSGVPQYSYVYWIDINHYYFINDIVSVNNDMWELHCEVDALATARQYIINENAFVKYSTNVYNEYLKDDRIQATSEIESFVSNNDFSSQFQTPSGSGDYYLLTVLNGENTSGTAGIKHYMINNNNIRYLCEKLVADGDSIIGGIKQIFADAKDSLLKLQLIPWSVSAMQQQGLIGSNTSYIYLGDYDTGQSGYMMEAGATYKTDDFIDIPSRDDNFTRIEPYCEAKIHIPLLGVYDLSLSELEDTNRIYFRYICNIASGKVTCILWKGSAIITDSNVKIIGSYDGNVNVEVPLGYATSQNPTGLLTGGISLAAAAIGSGALTLGGIAGAVASFSSYFTKQASVVGSFGGNASAYDSLKMSIYLIKRGLSEQPENLALLYGRPCGKVLNMQDCLDGYVETSQFQLSGPFDDAITQRVNSLMDSGVYLQ